ncbi:hypothetical protein DTO164E3_7564 [Paecilomyces variotii]|nr:hypothetical protein DTO032I3_7549 [Paecilomyces variotii]KAJ9193976.1 hypothetical protein DTO164E3_7564 [Paecilomyces variotii]KAJ9221212.1 hypothetical protein DTO169C6_6482 [Paecilomyces variotii]KAJ9238782.1 hypothetical protein DTO169E5_4615 [Paecilomyces variotii]KAJ9258619.1 hypothetical protein DTO207G8_1322 [Paecilomyces variotii]
MDDAYCDRIPRRRFRWHFLPSKAGVRASFADFVRMRSRKGVLMLSAVGFFVSLLLALSYLTVGVLSSPHDGHTFFGGKKDPMRPPQQKYLEEAASYSSSTFKKLKSTLKRIHVPEHYHNPHVFDDPRAEDPTLLPKIYHPYPDYESSEWKQTHRGNFQPCMGPRGMYLNESLEDRVGVYVGIPEGFPAPVFGTHQTIGLDGELSYDRYTRYGPYGFGEDEDDVKNWIKPAPVDWNRTDWGSLQRQCVERNAARYAQSTQEQRSAKVTMRPEHRTAILIRTYTNKEYSEDDKRVLRAMITELSLHSGGEYEVFLLVHVKDDTIQINKKEVYDQVVRETIPEEFWGIAKLWNIETVRAPYPYLNPAVVNVHQSQWLPVLWFMNENPQFDYFWNWEIDTRYTGHLYEFAEKVAEFGRNQPRRGMWERSERFYIPGLHGDYDNEFRKYVDQRVYQAIWGPMPAHDVENPTGPQPPVKDYRRDNYNWGVGEEADYISFLPIFNPQNTHWVLRDDVIGYEGITTPRRATIVTHSRLSRRLLQQMHQENLYGRHIGSEMFPQTIALLHGYKALYAPHPIWSDKPWKLERLDRWFNSGINGKSGNTIDSPFSWGREARFEDLSWYYRCNIPGRLYWNFLGWEKDNTGGPDYERRYGRHVLPSMLFHPIKDVQPNADSMSYRLPT